MLYRIQHKNLVDKKGSVTLSALRKLAITLGVGVAIGAAAFIFLAVWDPPAPTEEVRKVLPDDVFQE